MRQGVEPRLALTVTEKESLAMSNISALRLYLDATATSGAAPAECESIHEIAPGVWLVGDRYQGMTEYDIYFDTSRAAFMPGHENFNISDSGRRLLGALGLACSGSIASSRDFALRHAPTVVQPFGPWHQTPIDLSQR